jgi:hypothetical protein
VFKSAKRQQETIVRLARMMETKRRGKQIKRGCLFASDCFCLSLSLGEKRRKIISKEKFPFFAEIIAGATDFDDKPEQKNEFFVSSVKQNETFRCFFSITNNK